MRDRSSGKVLSLFILLGLTAFLFSKGGMLEGEFLNWDDLQGIVENKAVHARSPGDLPRIFTRPIYCAYLPLHFLSLAVDHLFFGLDPVGYHLTNLLIHLLNTSLVWLLILLLFKNPAVAFLAALFFSIHPVQAETVAWASERKGLLSALFVLAASVSLLKGVRSGKGKFLFLTFFLTAAAILSKGSAVIAPLLYLLLLAGEGRMAPLKRRIWILWILLLSLCMAGALLHYAVGVKEGPFQSAAGPRLPSLFSGAGEILARYLLHAALPLFLSADYPLGYEGFLGMGVAGTILILFLCALAFWLVWNLSKKGAFALAWFFLALLPYNTILPRISIQMADRYLYLALAGFAALGALAWERMVRGRGGPLRTALLLLVALVLLAEGWASFLRIQVWGRSERLWEDTLKKYPGSAVALVNRAHIHYKRALCSGARADWIAIEESLESAKSLRPPRPILLRIWRMLSWGLLAQGRVEEALESSREALHLLEEMKPVNDRWKVERGNILLEMGRVLEARGDRREAAAVFHEAAENPVLRSIALYNLGSVLTTWGLEEKAAGDAGKGEGLLKRGEGALKECIELDPSNRDAYLNLCTLYLGENEAVKAIAVLDRGIRDLPDFPEGFLRLAEIYLEFGQVEDAEREVTKALSGGKLLAGAFYLLGRIAFMKGEMEKGVEFYKKAIEARPGTKKWEEECGKALFVLAGRAARSKGGNLEKALALAQEGLALLPQDWRGHLLVAEIFRMGRRYSEAKRNLENALLLSGGNQEVLMEKALLHKKLGYALLMQGRREEGMGQFKEALVLFPEREDFREIRRLWENWEKEKAKGEKKGGELPRDGLEEFQRGVEEYKEGRIEEAEASFRRSLVLAEHFPPTHYYLGLILSRKGKKEEAILEYCKAVELDERFKEAYLNLGGLYLSIGEKEKAKECYLRYLELAPGEEHSKQVIEILEELGG